MPNLELLEIDDTVLERGRWEGVFYALRELPEPPGIGFFNDQFHFLWHRGPDICLEDYIYPEIKPYMEHGGRHPFLPDDEPDSAASHLFHSGSHTFGFMA